MAEALAVNGAAKVFLLGRRAEVIKDAAAKYPEVMVPVQCDVTSKESLQSAVDEISKTTKHINLLVANSGGAGEPIGYKPSMSLPELRAHLMSASMEAFTETLHVNTTGAYFTMVAFLELLDAGNKHAVSGGPAATGTPNGPVLFGAPSNLDSNAPSIQSQVIFTTSLAAHSRGWWTSPHYGSSKAALSFLMKQASTNLARYGIRANALAPGSTFDPCLLFLFSCDVLLPSTDPCPRKRRGETPPSSFLLSSASCPLSWAFLTCRENLADFPVKCKISWLTMLLFWGGFSLPDRSHRWHAWESQP